MAGGHDPDADGPTDDYPLFKRRQVLSVLGAGALSASAIGLGAAQSGDGADTHTIIIGDPDGSDLNDYQFVVSGEVERLNDPRGDDVSADGREASGTVAGGRDGYRYTGEISLFEYEGEIGVTIDGETVDPATLGGGGDDVDGGTDEGSDAPAEESPAGENEIRIVGVGE